MSVRVTWNFLANAFSPVSKEMLTAVALTAAVFAPAGRLPAGSFDLADQTESVLLGDIAEPEPHTPATPSSPSITTDAYGSTDHSHAFAGTISGGCANCTGSVCTCDGGSIIMGSGSDGCSNGVDGSCNCGHCSADQYGSSGQGGSGDCEDDGILGCIADRHCGRMVDCDPPGLFQKLAKLHKNSGACWAGRADALFLWRNAPDSLSLMTVTGGGPVVLNANQLESAMAAGPRFSLFRTDACGNAWETTYFRAFNFRSQRTLPFIDQGYDVAPNILTPTGETGLDGASMNLGSGIQSFEVNRYHCHGPNLRFLAGFRWVEWRESATLSTNGGTTSGTPFTDTYQSNVFNSLYGGQIGFDARVLSLKWLRVDSVMKGGAYGNNVAVNSLLVQENAGVNQPYSFSQSPASCGFVGELGFTGVLPITNCLDIRVGYLGLWLQGLAQPTRQYPVEDLAAVPPTGTIDTKGGTVVQGVSLGLEGRW